MNNWTLKCLSLKDKLFQCTTEAFLNSRISNKSYKNAVMNNNKQKLLINVLTKCLIQVKM